MPRIAPSVTTPVPPVPARITENGFAERRRAPTARRQRREAVQRRRRGLTRMLAPFTVTIAGQKPETQVRSRLQAVWSIVRLRPNSVSIGCTETQFDALPQSPQPSHTASLMTTRMSGLGIERPFLRRRRFIRGAGLVVDEDRRARHRRELRFCTASRFSRRKHRPSCRDRPAHALRVFLPGRPHTMAIAATPSAAHCCGDALDREATLDRLPAGHRDGVVIRGSCR